MIIKLIVNEIRKLKWYSTCDLKRGFSDILKVCAIVFVDCVMISFRCFMIMF